MILRNTSTFLHNRFWLSRPRTRWISSGNNIFVEKDRVLLRYVRDPEKTYLTAPLEPGKELHSHLGKIAHTDIISRRPRDILATNKGNEFRLSWPTLEEYIVRVPRIVTPIYPLEASTIVSLLDIHVSTPDPEKKIPRLEIFEAGTGHGSLTLALCQAIHAGNSHIAHEKCGDGERGAILHTLDISAKNSHHARGVVDGFRRGMYSGDVQFYAEENPTQWMRRQHQLRHTRPTEGEGQGTDDQGFLYAAILDMPNPEHHLCAAAQVIITDGIVGCFCPSITQIGECVKLVKEQRLPLALERVIEFPSGSGSVGAGLRRWDVRYARVRSRAGMNLSVEEAENKNGIVRKDTTSATSKISEDEYGMVCRPMAGERIVGGGFFVIFKRESRSRDEQSRDRDTNTEAFRGNVVKNPIYNSLERIFRGMLQILVK